MNLPPRLNTFLNADQTLRRLAGQAARLAAMQRHYDAIVPPALRHGSQVTELRQQTVVIAATSGALAAKLRQMTDQLISLFQARGCEVTGIRVRVQVNVSRPPAPSARRHLGAGAREALDRLQGQLPDSPLKAALRRLAHKR